MKNYVPTWPSKGKCLLIVLFLLFIYLLDNLSISGYIGYGMYNNAARPLFWMLLASAALVFPRIHIGIPERTKQNIFWWAVIFSVVYIAVQVCAGLLYGLGKSPYSHSAIGILLNVVTVGTMVTGREVARRYITVSLVKKEKLFVFIFISLFITLLGYPVSKFSELKNAEETVKFIAQYFAPDFCHNLFATYLAFIGGVAPAIAYMGILQAFHWLSPILPNLIWITAALIGIMCPIFFFVLMQSIYLMDTKAIKKSGRYKESPAGWMITVIMSIGIIWFAVGVFPVYPSVIATGSMEPLIMPGDVILVEKTQKEEDLQKLIKGDIIQFKVENFLVSHRIIEIVDGKNGRSYRTKGDNNNAPDTELVLAQNVKGKIVQIVPKIGWPTLLVRQKNDVPLEKVKF